MKYDCIDGVDTYTLDPIHITLVGCRACGKTSLLASMFHEMQQNPSMGIHANAHTSNILSGYYEDLIQTFRKSCSGLNAAEQQQEYTFMGQAARQATFKKKAFSYPFVFTDFPGNWYNKDASLHEEELKKIFYRSTSILLTIDAPALMNGIRMHHKFNAPMVILNWFNQCVPELKNGHTVIFVLTRCETYIHDRAQRYRMFELVRKEYGALIDLLTKNGIDCFGTWVETLGGVRFLRYDKGEYGQPVPVFERTGPYSPRNCEVPLVLTLQQCAKVAKQGLEDDLNSSWWEKFKDLFGIEHKQLAADGLLDVIERLKQGFRSSSAPNTFNLLSSEDDEWNELPIPQYNMKFIVDNSQFRDWASPVRNPIFPERFTKPGCKAYFDLVAGRENFGWNGIGGELYHAYAPLESTEWQIGEAAAYTDHFARWRCAVFAPDDIYWSHRVVPVVYAFTGIGSDYYDNSLYLWSVVKDLDCIFVTFDTHLTGMRVLTENKEPNNDHFAESIHIMEQHQCDMRDDVFREFVEELSFNVQQIQDMIRQRFCYPSIPPCLMLGFSLGGFYASQLARIVPNCIGCVGGGASPEIMQYKGGFDIPRKIPAPVINGVRIVMPQKMQPFASFVQGLKKITRTPFTGPAIGGVYTPFRFIVGKKDPIVNYKAVQKTDGCHFGFMEVFPIDDVGHTPANEWGLNELGSEMINQLRFCLDLWRRFKG